MGASIASDCIRAEFPPMATTKICLRFVINLMELCTIDSGQGVKGDQGCHHDFFMAVIMQNVRSAWCSLSQKKSSERSFEDLILMVELASDLFSESAGL